jgi:hypothetical protein
VADSTELVQQDKRIAHERIRDSFRHFSGIIENYRGQVLELRGDALLAARMNGVKMNGVRPYNLQLRLENL